MDRQNDSLKIVIIDLKDRYSRCDKNKVECYRDLSIIEDRLIALRDKHQKEIDDNNAKYKATQEENINLYNKNKRYKNIIVGEGIMVLLLTIILIL